MAVDTILNLFIKIFLMISLGYLLKKVRVITPELQKGFTSLLLKAILPINILASANTEFTKGASGKMLYMTAIGAGYYIGSLILMTVLSRLLPLKGRAKHIFVTMTVFANTAFVGFPLTMELFGQEGMIYAVIYNLFYQAFFFTYGINLLSGSKEFQWKSIYTNIVTIASVVSISIFLSPFRFPSAVVSALSSVGSMTVPVSMILIGCSLADIKLIEILKDGYSYLVSALRLLLLPLGLLFLLKLLKVPAEITAAATVMTALPSGSLNAIYAGQYGCEPEYATRTVVQTMVFMIVTLPAVIFLIHWVL
jgi:malate permease and related proteins